VAAILGFALPFRFRGLMLTTEIPSALVISHWDLIIPAIIRERVRE